MNQIPYECWSYARRNQGGLTLMNYSVAGILIDPRNRKQKVTEPFETFGSTEEEAYEKMRSKVSQWASQNNANVCFGN